MKDLTALSITFPPMPEPTIARPQCIAAIEDLFDDGKELIWLDADDGGGKTVLASNLPWLTRTGLSLSFCDLRDV